MYFINHNLKNIVLLYLGLFYTNEIILMHF